MKNLPSLVPRVEKVQCKKGTLLSVLPTGATHRLLIFKGERITLTYFASERIPLECLDALIREPIPSEQLLDAEISEPMPVDQGDMT